MSGARQPATWALLTATLLAVLPATAEDSDRLAEVKTWHTKVAAAKGALPADLGRQALEQLKKWGFAPTGLEPEARRQLLELEICGCLATGDAARAKTRLTDLQAVAPDARETLRLAWFVGLAAGDAALGKRTLAHLKEKGVVKAEAVAERLQWLELVGEAAPDRELTAEPSRSVALRRRAGVVLLLDFWTLREKPDQQALAALRDLLSEFTSQRQVEFVGVNLDAQTDAARTFATEAGYGWPQVYAAGDAQTLSDAFHVRGPWWQVIVDGDGFVRAAGSIREPGLVYALRSAVAEARGDHVAVRPVNVDGQPAQVAASEQKKDEAAEQEPPHDPEAARLLDQARLYLKTGKKTEARKLLQELIEKYPNTWEAREARRLGLI